MLRLQFRTVFIGAIVLGVLFRVWAVVVQGVPYSDGRYYMAMGASFAAGKEFLMPWELNPGPLYTPAPSHHFLPMWPIVLAAAYAVAGFSVATTMATSLVVSLILIPVVFFTTRDLLGAEKAWLVTSIVSLYFFFIEVTDYAYSENLLTIFYVLTIWAILRSLKDPRYIVLAGLFAGLGYLTKAAVGYFFLLAGVAGFLWRFYYVRWRVFKDRYYVTAILVFLTFVVGWTLRNMLTFGLSNWETSPYTSAALANAFGQPTQLVPVLAAKVFLFFTFFGTVGLFFAPQLLRQVKLWKDETVSALLLAIALPATLGVIFAASFTLYEDFAALWWIEQIRYVLMAFVPLLWLAVRQEPLPRDFRLQARLPSLRTSLPPMRSVALRIALFAVAGFAFYEINRMIGLIFLVGALLLPRLPTIRVSGVLGLVVVLGLASLNAATTVIREPQYDAGELLGGIVNDGDIIAIVNVSAVYDMYPYLAGREITLVSWDGTGNNSGADFVLANRPLNLSGHRLLATFRSTETPGWLDSAYIYVSRTIRANLGLPIATGSPSDSDLFLYEAIT